MGQHVDIIAIYIGDTDITARFRVRQLRLAVLVMSTFLLLHWLVRYL